MTVEKITIETTPSDLLQRFHRFPDKLDKVMRKTMEAALLTAQEKIPAYPPQPAGSKYIRRGAEGLGGSLGVGMSGGGGGVAKKASIHVIRSLGVGGYEGQVGTNLGYAEYVIGERQARHMGHWWTVKVWSKAAEEKIIKLFNNTMQQLADFLEGKGL